MFGLFNKTPKKDIKAKEKSKYGQSSIFGRSITTIDSSREELFHEAIPFNPLKYFKKDKSFFGLDHITGEPVYLERDKVVHALITAPTRAGKGIFIAYKCIEAMREPKGLIVIDPKEDEWLPQVIKEELERQKRPNDFYIWNWTNDFGYKTFEDDTYQEATDKLVTMLNLIEVESEAGASHYRKSERIALFQIMSYFFNSQELLNIEYEKTLLNFIAFSECLLEDLISSTDYDRELNKPKPNMNLLKELAKRFFDPSLFSSNIKFKEKHITTLESLVFSLSEFKHISFTEESSIIEALTNGKVIYIKSNMLSQPALKFLKFILADILAKSRKYKANTLVIADELSFYPTPILAATLSTVAGFGTKFFIAYQDDGQLESENLKSALKSNCQTKIYYKSSDVRTLEYIEKMCGEELVTKMSIQGETRTIRQETETFFNLIRQRALPKSNVAILIDESIAKTYIFDTQPIPVSRKFNWQNINTQKRDVNVKRISKFFNLLEKKQKNVSSKIDGINSARDDSNEVVKTIKFEL